MNSEAETWKDQGNLCYRSGKHEEAIVHFTKAIALDSRSSHSSKYFLNRSLCYAGLNDFVRSAEDARMAVTIDEKYEKAHYRFIKALLELRRYKEARIALLYAMKVCCVTDNSRGSRDFKQLEDEIYACTQIPVRPRSTDFEIVDELGDGNFSKVYKARFKPSGVVYAVKTIERATADRMKRRHPNINNEILMEKRVLQKLTHPNIVTLFSTFQDFGTLYYQMEFIEGGDLWSSMQDKLVCDKGAGFAAPVGCHWSQLRFYCAEMINALEYMHRYAALS